MKELIINITKYFKRKLISARNGNSEAQVSLAINYLKEKNYNNAQQWAQISANAGNPQGMWILSRIHKQMNNSEKEFEFVQKAAKLGYGAALVSLYKKKNPKFSIIFFEAAKNKSSIGLYFYGKQLIYVNNRIDDGLKALNEASELGYTKAIKKLIDLYENGKDGVEKNVELANKYTQMLKNTKEYE